MDVAPNLPKDRVRVGIDVVPSLPKGRVRVGIDVLPSLSKGLGMARRLLVSVPVPNLGYLSRAVPGTRLFSSGSTEVTKISGTGTTDVVPSLPKCRVRVRMPYQTYQSVKHGMTSTKAKCQVWVIQGVCTPCTLWYIPYLKKSRTHDFRTTSRCTWLPIADHEQDWQPYAVDLYSAMYVCMYVYLLNCT